jgi:hypothetical protein
VKAPQQGRLGIAVKELNPHEAATLDDIYCAKCNLERS